MTLFWILIALIFLVSLMLIWIPHFRQQTLNRAEEAKVRNQTNLELFNDRLASLEKEFNEQLLDQKEFAALKKELEISLLQDMQQGQDESLSHKIQPKSILMPSLMSIIMILVAGCTYLHLGAYQEIPLIQNQQMAGNNPHAGMSREQLITQEVIMFESQIKSNPNNSEAWFNLGHAYTAAKRYTDAVQAFDNVIALVGPQAEILGSKATALYYKNDQKITPKIQKIIDKALVLDPKDPSTLLLIGMNAFFKTDYSKAINAWETILTSDRPDIDRQALINAIDAAKARMSYEITNMPKDSKHKNIIANKSKVTLNVSIAPELKNKVEASDVIFVFARATNGNRIPLAATKINANALPTKVVLDNSTQMGTTSLSDAKNVEVIAVLSKSGNVKPQAGDLQGSLKSITVGDTASLVLNTLIK